MAVLAGLFAFICVAGAFAAGAEELEIRCWSNSGWAWRRYRKNGFLCQRLQSDLVLAEEREVDRNFCVLLGKRKLGR
ncbi:hypothetical protein BDW68DRAFT_167299 [Aspergillus falconensis]